MSNSKKTAQRVFREWCAANGIIVEVMAAADLIRRIEQALEAKTS